MYGEPTQLLTNGNHLDVLIAGEGQPTVVFVCGFSGTLDVWRLVQPRLAEDCQALSYNRAGLGRSTMASKGNTLADFAEELFQLLTVAKIYTPIILVAHSMGAYVARNFIDRYPDKVAGLVIVEGGHERIHLESILTEEEEATWNKRFNQALEQASPANKKEMQALYKLFTQPELEVPKFSNLPNIPIHVILSIQEAFQGHGESAKNEREIIHKLVERQCKQHPRCTLVTTRQSGHVTQEEEPDLVISTIRENISQARIGVGIPS